MIDSIQKAFSEGFDREDVHYLWLSDCAEAWAIGRWCSLVTTLTPTAKIKKSRGSSYKVNGILFICHYHKNGEMEVKAV